MPDIRNFNNSWVLETTPDISSMGWIDVDITDGTWTQAGSATILSGSSVDVSKVHTFNFNAVGSSDNDNTFAVGSNFTGPRWYKPLNNNNGTRLTSDDNFTIMYHLVVETPSQSDKVGIAFGYCVDPTSNVLATIDGNGALHSYNSAGSTTPRIGVWTRTSSGLTSNANIKHAMVVNGPVVGRRHPAGNYTGLDSSLAFIQGGSRNVNQTMASGQNLSIAIFAGVVGSNTTISACDIKLKLKYRVIQFDTLQG